MKCIQLWVHMPHTSHASTVQAPEDGGAVDNRWSVSENRCRRSCSKKLSNKTITRLPTIARVDSLKILGVTFTRSLSASEHIGNILKSCSQSLYALRVRLLRAHGLCDTAIQTIFRAVIIAKLTYTKASDLSLAGQYVAATMTLIYHCLMNYATMLTNNYLTVYEEIPTIPYIISCPRNL